MHGLSCLAKKTEHQPPSIKSTIDGFRCCRVLKKKDGEFLFFFTRRHDAVIKSAHSNLSCAVMRVVASMHGLSCIAKKSEARTLLFFWFNYSASRVVVLGCFDRGQQGCGDHWC